MTENELHALVDGRLTPVRQAEVEAWLAAHPDSAAQTDAWRRQRALIDRIEVEVLDEPVPARLVAVLDAWPRAMPTPGAAAESMSEPARDPSSGSPYAPSRAPSSGSMNAPRGGHAAPARTFADRLAGWLPRPRTFAAACAVAVVGWLAGWLSHAGWTAREGAGIANAPAFVGDARRAHVTFVPEVRHPVEVEAAQHEHLVQWLSKRLGRPLKVPMLQDDGFTLLGGRLLPVAGAVGAQFMYQGGDGQRLTLHVAALERPAQSAETAFRIVEDGGTASFYWIDRGFGYTVTGKLPRERMLAIAKSVYEQTSE